MPYMTPTYPENIRLLGPSSWEEIEAQQTTDRPQEFHPLTHIMHVANYWFFIPKPRFARLG